MPVDRPFRLVAVMTHPVQYLAPWFRFIHRERREIDLKVIYVSEPAPAQQGVGFGTEFEWDVPLREGYPNVVLRPPNPSDHFGYDRFLGLDASEVGDAIVASRPDAALINGWHSISLVRAIFTCRRRGIPLLYRGDSNLSGRGRDLAYLPWRLKTRWWLSRFDRYLSVGARSREYLQSFGHRNGKIFDSPHAVDNQLFLSGASSFLTRTGRARARSEWGLSTAADVVLFVGKLEEHKRPLDLVRAASALPNAAILVVGAGPLENECRRLARELGVEAVFPGFLNQSQLGKAYAVADCLAVTSTWETWGLVVNEALATGLPAVVSDRVGCAPDLIEPGSTGAVYPFGDITSLTRALEETLAKTKSRRAMRDACRETVRGYSFEAATEGLSAAIRSLE